MRRWVVQEWTCWTFRFPRGTSQEKLQHIRVHIIDDTGDREDNGRGSGRLLSGERSRVRNVDIPEPASALFLQFPRWHRLHWGFHRDRLWGWRVFDGVRADKLGKSHVLVKFLTNFAISSSAPYTTWTQTYSTPGSSRRLTRKAVWWWW